MANPSNPNATQLLERIQDGDRSAADSVSFTVMSIEPLPWDSYSGMKNRLLEIVAMPDGYDTVVLAAGNIAEDNMYFELKGKVDEIYRVGDCVAPRKTDMAIIEGRRVGEQL